MISQAPLPALVTNGSMVMLDCVAEGTPTPNVMWLLNREPVNLTNDIFQQLENNSLLISEASQHTAGLFTCLAQNDFALSSASALVDIVPASSVLTNPFQDIGKYSLPLELCPKF